MRLRAVNLNLAVAECYRNEADLMFEEMVQKLRLKREAEAVSSECAEYETGRRLRHGGEDVENGGSSAM